MSSGTKGACHIAGLPAVSVLQELPPQPAESEAGVDHDVADDNPEEEPQRPPQGWRRHWTAAPHWPVTWRSERAGGAFGFVRAAPAPLHDTPRLADARRMARDHSSGDGDQAKLRLRLRSALSTEANLVSMLSPS